MTARRACALAVGSAILISSCTAKPTELTPASVTPSAHQGQLTRIVYINPLPNNPLWDGIGVCMKAEAVKSGITVEVEGPPGGNVNVQVMQNLVSQAVASKAQALVTWSSGGGAALDPLFAQARAQGSLVATLLSSGATANQNFEVGLQYPDWARLQIQAVAKRPGPQHVGVIWQKAVGAGWADYVTALKDEVTKHPNVVLEDIQYNNGDFREDVRIASTMLTTHPKINILVNYSGFPGVLTAIREKRLQGRVHAIIGSDYPEPTIGYINEGLIAGIFVIDSCLAGRTVVQRLLDAWAGKPVERVYGDGSKIVTGEEFKALNAGVK